MTAAKNRLENIRQDGDYRLHGTNRKGITFNEEIGKAEVSSESNRVALGVRIKVGQLNSDGN